MARELDLIEQFRVLSLVCEVIVDSLRLGMLKLTSGFLDEIRKSQKLDVALVNRLSLINQSEYENFRVDENKILRFHNRVCVPDVPELKKRILEKSHRSSLSIHTRATKMYQDLKKMFWWPEMKRDMHNLFIHV